MLILQSMPDGIFKYLLNYIDHGVKFLWSVPLVAKQASCISLALYKIFCTIGAPMILQTDNGKEFSGSAMTNKRRRRDEAVVGKKSEITSELLTKVVTEVQNLWLECIMVTGTPCHSESNRGVERVNRTVQQKLHAWMKKNNSTRWSIGCKTVQWQVNTQYHATVKNVPYTLVFGQQPRVGISNLLVDKTIMDKLHTEKELNQVTTVQFHGALDDDREQHSRDHSLADAFPEFGASDKDDEEVYTDINYDSESMPPLDAPVDDGAVDAVVWWADAALFCGSPDHWYFVRHLFVGVCCRSRGDVAGR